VTLASPNGQLFAGDEACWHMRTLTGAILPRTTHALHCVPSQNFRGVYGEQLAISIYLPMHYAQVAQ